MLIVVAIIGVLVAISIPIFNSQLEKSREAVDEANIRSAYAVIAADALSPDTNIATNNTDKIAYTAATADTPAYAEVTATQTQAEWQTNGGTVSIAGQASIPAVVSPAKWKVTVTSDGAPSIAAE